MKIAGNGYVKIKDSMILIPFNGKFKIANYSGWTRYNLINSKYEYELDLAFDTINLNSKLILDNDNLWKIITTSLTDGVAVKGISYLDTETFEKLQKPIKLESVNSFGIGIFSASDRLYGLLNFDIFKNDYSVLIGYSILKYETSIKFDNSFTMSGGIIGRF